MTNVQVSLVISLFFSISFCLNEARSPSTDNESDSIPTKNSRLKPRSTTLIQSTPRQQPSNTYVLKILLLSSFLSLGKKLLLNLILRLSIINLSMKILVHLRSILIQICTTQHVNEIVMNIIRVRMIMKISMISIEQH